MYVDVHTHVYKSSNSLCLLQLSSHVQKQTARPQSYSLIGSEAEKAQQTTASASLQGRGLILAETKYMNKIEFYAVPRQ